MSGKALPIALGIVGVTWLAVTVRVFFFAEPQVVGALGIAYASFTAPAIALIGAGLGVSQYAQRFVTRRKE